MNYPVPAKAQAEIDKLKTALAAENEKVARLERENEAITKES